MASLYKQPAFKPPPPLPKRIILYAVFTLIYLVALTLWPFLIVAQVIKGFIKP